MRAHRNDGAAADAEAASAAAAVAAIRRRRRPERAATDRSEGNDADGAGSCDCSDCWTERFLFSSSPGLGLCSLQYNSSGICPQPDAPTALSETRWAAPPPPLSPAAGAAAMTATDDNRSGNSCGQLTKHLPAHWYGAMAPLDSNVFDSIYTVQCGVDGVDDLPEFGGGLFGAGFLRRARRAPPPSAFTSLLPQQRLLVTSGGALSPVQPDVTIPLTVPTCESPCYDADASGNASLVPTTVLRLRVSMGDCCSYLTSGGGGGGGVWSEGGVSGYGWLDGGLGLRVSRRCSNNETHGTAVPTATAVPIPCPQSALYTPRVAATASWQAQMAGAFLW